MVDPDIESTTPQAAQSVFYFDRDLERAAEVEVALAGGGYRVEHISATDAPIPSKLELAEHEAIVLEAQGNAIAVAEHVLEELRGPSGEPVVPVVLLVDRDNKVPFPAARSLPALRVPFKPAALLRLLDLQLEWTEDNQRTSLYVSNSSVSMPIAVPKSPEAKPAPAKPAPTKPKAEPRAAPAGRARKGWSPMSAAMLGAGLVSLVIAGLVVASALTSDEPVAEDAAVPKPTAERVEARTAHGARH